MGLEYTLEFLLFGAVEVKLHGSQIFLQTFFAQRTKHMILKQT
jgi:hypothetical protein